MVTLEERVPSSAEYAALREAVGWKVPGSDACERALLGTRVGVCAVESGVAVGMGRLMGDGALYWFIVDVVVDPAHQGSGVGRGIVTALEAAAVRGSAVGGVNLVAARDVAGFYERLGFEDTGSLLMVKRSYNRKLWMRDLKKGATYPPS